MSAAGKIRPLAQRPRGEGERAPSANIPQPATAGRSQVEKMRARLSCDDARFWFDFQIRQAQNNLLVTEVSLSEFVRWAEAEAETDYYQREKTRRREAGQPIPLHEFYTDENGERAQGMGIETLFSKAHKRAERCRAKLGFNPTDITRIRTLRQSDMWEEPSLEAARVVNGLMSMCRNTALGPGGTPTPEQTTPLVATDT